jgi:hypothetical protein
MKKLGQVIGSIFGGEGGIVSGVVDIIGQFHSSPEDKHRAAMAVKEFLHRKELETVQQGLEVEKEFNDRIKELEGTAQDLKHFGFFGTVIVFLRGAFRPLVSYAMGYVDIMVFSGQWKLPEDDQIVSAFWILNLVIFTFYFGERAIKNIIPVLGMYFGKPIEPK